MANHVQNWKSVCWGDLATLEYGKALREYKEGNDPFPVYGTNGQIGWHSEYLYPKAGVIVGRKGAYRGIHFSKKPFFVIDTAFYLKPKDEKTLDIEWAYYQLLNFDINEIDSGSAIPSTSREAFYAIHVQLPPMTSQRKIASILSAYDDLIENNLRRIKILEEMAQTLYREWFVKFRFPGHQKVKMVDSPSGKIPEGWEVKLLKDICENINYGYTASAKQEAVGPKFLRITDIVPYLIDWHSVPYCEILEKEFPKYLLKEGDIVIARTGATTGYAKRINKMHPESVFASYLVRIRIKSSYSDLHVGLLLESDEYKRFIKKNVGGSAQPQANAQVLSSFPILIPSHRLLSSFDLFVRDLFDQRDILHHKNMNLRRTRDLLLPKIISGELDVSELDIAIP